MTNGKRDGKIPRADGRHHPHRVLQGDVPFAGNRIGNDLTIGALTFLGKPFKGIRPPKAMVEKVASRPYDVLNSEEARKEAEGNEKSLYHIIKPEIDFPAGTDEHDAKVYE